MSGGDADYQWLSLFNVDGLGAKRLHAIHRAVKEGVVTLDEVFQLDQPELSSRLPMLKLAIYQALQEIDGDEIEELYERLRESDISLIHPQHRRYPDLLLNRVKAGAPAILFCRGCLDLLSADSAAIVGARDASPSGLEAASQIAARLSGEGINIVSGFAKGIDTEAHRGAVESGGTTTFVWSSGILSLTSIDGIDDIPWNDRALAVSQFHPNAGWSPANAMIRSRLVCALSRVVIVIESGPERNADGKNSGTFATAKLAMELNIPLLVVSPEAFERPPGGNEMLIRLGGIEVTPDGAPAEVVTRIAECDRDDISRMSSYRQLTIV